LSPAHGVWFETDVIDRFMFGDDDDDDDDATSLPQYGFVPVGSITPAEVHETGSAVDHDNLKYKIDTVTVVTGIDKRINLSHLCDAAPDVFGVRSQGIRLLTVFGQSLFDSQQVSSPRLPRQVLQAASEMDATFLYLNISAMMAMLLLALYTRTERFK